MSQATEFMLATACVITALAFLLGAVLRQGTRIEPGTAEPVPGAFAVLAFRYCPAELRTRAAVIHHDGSGACLDCGANIEGSQP